MQAVSVKGPVILAGDFNTPPESAIVRELWPAYTDAFSAAGWGSGYTFTGGETTVRIDHILTNEPWHQRALAMRPLPRVGPAIGSAPRIGRSWST